MIRTAPDIALLTPSFKGGLGLKSIMDNIEIQLIDSCHYLLNHYQNVYGCRTFIQILLNQMAILQRTEIILNFDIVKQIVEDVVLVPEGKVCSTILKLYNEEAIVVEPAGALSIAALDFYKEEIKGKNVVCIVSGSNNDITRMEEIKERSLLYEGLKHYFIVRFPQRAGALREFVSKVLGTNDDITHFEYTKKVNRERGPALVGVELKHPKDFERLMRNMDKYNISYELLNERFDIFNFLF